MATRNKLKGVSPHELAKLSNERGQKAVAQQYGVSQATISRHITRAGYEPTVIYVLKERAGKAQHISNEAG